MPPYSIPDGLVNRQRHTRLSNWLIGGTGFIGGKKFCADLFPGGGYKTIQLAPTVSIRRVEY